MPHSFFQDSAEDLQPPSFWLSLRDLGTSLVVIMAIALICGFLLLPPVHAQTVMAPATKVAK